MSDDRQSMFEVPKGREHQSEGATPRSRRTLVGAASAARPSYSSIGTGVRVVVPCWRLCTGAPEEPLGYVVRKMWMPALDITEGLSESGGVQGSVEGHPRRQCCRQTIRERCARATKVAVAPMKVAPRSRRGTDTGSGRAVSSSERRIRCESRDGVGASKTSRTPTRVVQCSGKPVCDIHQLPASFRLRRRSRCPPSMRGFRVRRP